MANAKDLAKALGGYFTVGEVTDYGPSGVNLTITAAEIERVGQGRDAEDKPVLSFKESPKKLVLSKGRCSSLSDLFGNDELAGKAINIFIAIERSKATIAVRPPQ